MSRIDPSHQATPLFVVRDDAVVSTKTGRKMVVKDTSEEGLQRACRAFNNCPQPPSKSNAPLAASAASIKTLPKLPTKAPNASRISNKTDQVYAQTPFLGKLDRHPLSKAADDDDDDDKTLELVDIEEETSDEFKEEEKTPPKQLTKPPTPRDDYNSGPESDLDKSWTSASPTASPTASPRSTSIQLGTKRIKNFQLAKEALIAESKVADFEANPPFRGVMSNSFREINSDCKEALKGIKFNTKCVAELKKAAADTNQTGATMKVLKAIVEHLRAEAKNDPRILAYGEAVRDAANEFTARGCKAAPNAERLTVNVFMLRQVQTLIDADFLKDLSPEVKKNFPKITGELMKLVANYSQRNPAEDSLPANKESAQLFNELADILTSQKPRT